MDNKWKVICEIYQYDISRKIGSGQFGNVYRGEIIHQNKANEACAIKVIVKTQIRSRFDYVFSNEENALNLKSDYVVKTFETNQSFQNYYIIMEYCSEGNLQQFVDSNGGKLQEEQAFHFFMQILSALKFLQEKNIMHRDLNPENILIYKTKNIKLCHFGFSKLFKDKDEQVKNDLGKSGYKAPEVMKQGQQDFNVDIYSAGVILFWMLEGRLPFGDTRAANQKNMNRKPEFLYCKDSGAQNLILLMLSEDPKRRNLEDIQKRLQSVKAIRDLILKGEQYPILSKLELVKQLLINSEYLALTIQEIHKIDLKNYVFKAIFLLFLMWKKLFIDYSIIATQDTDQAQYQEMLKVTAAQFQCSINQLRANQNQLFLNQAQLAEIQLQETNQFESLYFQAMQEFITILHKLENSQADQADQIKRLILHIQRCMFDYPVREWKSFQAIKSMDSQQLDDELIQQNSSIVQD